jgi:hypothetical protein
MSDPSAITSIDQLISDLLAEDREALTAPTLAEWRAVKARRLATELAMVRELPALVARAERESGTWPVTAGEAEALIRRIEDLVHNLIGFKPGPPAVRGPRRGRSGDRRRRIAPRGFADARAVARTRDRDADTFVRLGMEAREVVRRLLWLRNREAGAAADRTPDAGPPPARGGRKKKTKGKDVNGRLQKLCTERPECLGWSARQLALHLGCAKSSVTGAPYWETILAVQAERQVRAVSERKDREGIKPGRRRPRKMPADRN